MFESHYSLRHQTKGGAWRIPIEEELILAKDPMVASFETSSEVIDEFQAQI